MQIRPLCWLEHLSLHNETGLDPPGIRVRAVPGLVAADYFAPGYFVWAVLIENLAKIGYEGKNMHMAAYDWRLSFQNTEVKIVLLQLLSFSPCATLPIQITQQLFVRAHLLLHTYAESSLCKACIESSSAYFVYYYHR